MGTLLLTITLVVSALSGASTKPSDKVVADSTPPAVVAVAEAPKK